MTLAEQFGRNLFMARRRLGVSQEALGDMAGMHRTEVGKLENGKRAPGLVTIVKLARALGIDPAGLVEGLRPPGAAPPVATRRSRSDRADLLGTG